MFNFAASDKCPAYAMRYPRLPAVSIGMSRNPSGIHDDGIKVVAL